MMKSQMVEQSWDSVECDALVVPVFQDEDGQDHSFKDLDQRLDGLIREVTENEEWDAKEGQFSIIYRPQNLTTSRVLLAGAGKRESYDSDSVRRLAMNAARRLKSTQFKKIAFCDRGPGEGVEAARAAVEGALLATYDGDDYKTTDKSRTFFEEVLFVGRRGVNSAEVEKAMNRAGILAGATNLARRLVNEPGNRMNPSLLAQRAVEVGEKVGLDVEVLDEAAMQQQEMGGVLAVARGSDEPARFIVMRYLGASEENARPIVLIGKGVTFDSGGISLKPSESMEEMKADKAGACAVLGAMEAIAQLGVKKNVVGLIPAVENLPSGRAQRPGDVIRSMSGKTIEVINTDAEGRLILADALHYGRQLNPEYMVDIATLTGACVVALGHYRAGFFTNKDELGQKLMEAAVKSGEKLWQLPLDDHYRKDIESSIADIKNVGSRWGGAITAAKFLEEFVSEIPWCHIDMAGVDIFKGEGKGPSGFGVRTLVEMVSG